MLLSCRKISMFLPFRSRQGFQRLKACTTRHLCTSNGPNENEKSKESAPLTFYEKWQPHSMKIGVGAAASLTLYGLSSFMWDMTYNIMTMSPASGMYYGFVSGVGITSMAASSAYYVRTATKVDVNEVLHTARRTLNSSEDLRSLLGGYIYVGDLAGFRHTYGSWKVSGFIPKWQSPKVEIVFNVYSGKNEGLATIEASQKGLYASIDFLGVDVLNQAVTRVLVHGDASGFDTHDAMKSLIKLRTSSVDSECGGHE